MTPLESLTRDVRALLAALENVDVSITERDMTKVAVSTEQARIALHKIYESAERSDRVLQRLVDVLAIESKE